MNNTALLAPHAALSTETRASASSTSSRPSLRTRTNVLAGGFGGTHEPPSGLNHGLKVKSGLKAGWISKPAEPPSGLNHGLKVKSGLKAGWISKPAEPPSGLNHGVRVKRAPGSAAACCTSERTMGYTGRVTARTANTRTRRSRNAAAHQAVRG